MKFVLPSLLFCTLFAGAQPADLFTKAPPDVDDALRARIAAFYQAHVSGRFSDAFQLVADDSKDIFLGSGRDTYKSCEISKINYSENFTKADVVTACKGEYRSHGERMPATMPLPSTWKLVNGQWYWYAPKRDKIQTPFGTFSAPAGNQAQNDAPRIPADPLAVARDILLKVTLNKSEVQLKGYETSTDEIQLTNNMPGPIRFTISFPPSQGLSVNPGKAELKAGEKMNIVFTYDKDEAAALCKDCLKVVKPSVTARIQVEPTAQVFPVNITFAIPPELEKLIPNEARPPKP